MGSMVLRDICFPFGRHERHAEPLDDRILADDRASIMIVCAPSRIQGNPSLTRLGKLGSTELGLCDHMSMQAATCNGWSVSTAY